MLSSLVEGLINRYLSVDQDLGSALRTLDGRMIVLEVQGTPVHLVFHFLADGVLVRRVEEMADGETQVPDVHIRGTPFALARLAREGGADPTLGGQVRIHGDIEVAQKLAGVLSGFEFDWEELLSRITGDVAAHQIGRVARGIGEFATRTRVTLERDLGEYLVEERQLVPSRADIESLAGDVDDLRDDVARLEKRVQRLTARLTADHRE